MGEVRVHGPEARSFLGTLVTNDVDRLSEGRAIYTVMCYEDGGVVDDLIIYQVGDEEYFLCINASNAEKDVEWMAGQAVGFECLVDDVSDTFGQLAVQGPRALEIIHQVSGEDFSGLKRFTFLQGDFLGTQAVISRTGYTGEDGIELYLPSGETARIANHILEGGKDLGLCLAGLGARDSLRLEAGYPLYGHEISPTIDPLTGGLGWVVKFDKPHRFIGWEALREKQAAGLENRVVFFRMEDRRIARQGAKVFAGDGTPAGEVLSGTQSPILGKPIGSALVRSSAAGQSLFVEIRDHRFPIEVSKPPLHKG